MKKYLFLLISSMLFARENPFVPIVKINNPSPIEEIKEFKKTAFSVPSDARILNKMKLIYTNVDGTLKEFELDINEALDWHKVYMLLDAQELTNQDKEEAKTELKEVDKIKLALKNQENANDDNSNVEQNTTKITEVKKEENKENKISKTTEYTPLSLDISNNFKIVIDKKNISIKTNSELIREFSLKKPNRIVMDFKINPSLKNKSFEIKANYFDEIYTGVHRNFYRLVIKLDGIYNYNIEKKSKEYLIKLQ
ncbi:MULTISPECIES: AMIN domain-containing protein [unclassified Campylobacter]|uniref:AMIN domain-containing protein n=1 Tax=unclassified Campylobacter TaxID=2593542 RepID=UPI002024E197|nr:AMIN domain-containing protein [Campylobacter sp. 2018MI01]